MGSGPEKHSNSPEAPRKNWALESGHQGPSLACGSLNQFFVFLTSQACCEGEGDGQFDRELVGLVLVS